MVLDVVEVVDMLDVMDGVSVAVMVVCEGCGRGLG